MVAVVRERRSAAYEGVLSCFFKGCLSELPKREQEVAPLSCGHCAASCFCTSELQNHCDLPADARFLFGGIKKT